MRDDRPKPRETDRKASGNMMRFVVTIFVIALLVAGVWFFVLTPEVPR